MLQVGDQAPDIQVQTDSGENFQLSQMKGKRVVLYFYPRADTPGCTVEACEFRDEIQAFGGKGAAVVGVSPDKPAAQAKFKQKYDLPFTLLADQDKTAAEAYGVYKEKNMYGKKVMGIVRTTFVIGPDGKIERIYHKVKAKGHAAEVLPSGPRATPPKSSPVSEAPRRSLYRALFQNPNAVLPAVVARLQHLRALADHVRRRSGEERIDAGDRRGIRRRVRDRPQLRILRIRQRCDQAERTRIAHRFQRRHSRNRIPVLRQPLVAGQGPVRRDRIGRKIARQGLFVCNDLGALREAVANRLHIVGDLLLRRQVWLSARNHVDHLADEHAVDGCDEGNLVKRGGQIARRQFVEYGD